MCGGSVHRRHTGATILQPKEPNQAAKPRTPASPVRRSGSCLVHVCINRRSGRPRTRGGRKAASQPEEPRASPVPSISRHTTNTHHSALARLLSLPRSSLWRRRRQQPAAASGTSSPRAIGTSSSATPASRSVSFRTRLCLEVFYPLQHGRFSMSRCWQDCVSFLVLWLLIRRSDYEIRGYGWGVCGSATVCSY